MIKVLLADDSALTRAVLKDIFQATADIQVVGEAENGKVAVAMTELLKPDLVILDILMPVMDGLAAIEEIMAHNPTPILVLSATVEDREVDLAFTAIKKGALDVMEKPAGVEDNQASQFAERISERVRLLARIKVIRHPRRTPPKSELLAIHHAGGARNILAIGASTGGPKAVMSIVKSLPADLRATVFIVQHIASGFARGFAQWLDRESDIAVRLAKDGDGFREGEVLVAPSDQHMIVCGDRIKLTDDSPVNCCRPSIDLLFSSLASERGGEVVALLLTGMGRDGAEGLRRIRQQGGVTIVQDEQSCAVFGMPKAALELDAADEVLPLAGIPKAVSKIFAY